MYIYVIPCIEYKYKYVVLLARFFFVIDCKSDDRAKEAVVYTASC